MRLCAAVCTPRTRAFSRKRREAETYGSSGDESEEMHTVPFVSLGNPVREPTENVCLFLPHASNALCGRFIYLLLASFSLLTDPLPGGHGSMLLGGRLSHTGNEEDSPIVCGVNTRQL